MRSLFVIAECIARTSEPVLITGETGVGKNLLAQAIHDVSGREGRFVEVNVAGLDDTLFSDTLFGRRKGAFTTGVDPRDGLVHKAQAGTLFLNEIGDLSIPSQIKLLQLLDSRQYYPLGSDVPRRTDARVVAATNRDLNVLMSTDRFRRDLYHRLSTHEMAIPPLRDRKGDLPLLVRHFMEEAARDLGREAPAAPAELLGLMSAYGFPGNVRELRSKIHDAMSRQTSNRLSLAPFEAAIGLTASEVPVQTAADLLVFGETLPTLAQAEELLIEEALRRSQGSQRGASAHLGISRQALNQRLRRKRAKEEAGGV